MFDYRNLFYGGLHFFRKFDDAWQAWIAGKDASKQVVEDSFNFAIDQVVNLELVKPVCLFQLPGAGSADDDLRFVFLNDRMGDDANELMRIYRHQVFSGQLGINVGGVGDTEWVMSMDRQDPGLRSHELLQLVQIADYDIFFSIFPQKQGLDHSQPVGHILGPAIWPGFVLKRGFVEESVAVFDRNGG